MSDETGGAHWQPTSADLFPQETIPSESGTTRDASDGRVALRLRNRQTVIDALISLVDEGNTSPSMEELVERSGLSERSIFRYFVDLADLSVAAIRAVVDRALPHHSIPDLGEGTLEHRIDQLIASRVRLAEQAHAFGTLARNRMTLTPEIPKALAMLVVSLRTQLSAQFAPEFAALPEDETAVLMDVLLTLLSYEGLEVIGNQLGNDLEAVARRWRFALNAVLTPS